MGGSFNLLLEGLRRCVGNDKSTKVWEDAWLPGEGTHFVPYPLPNSNPQLRVNDVLDMEMGAGILLL